MKKLLCLLLLCAGSSVAQTTDPQELWSSASAWTRDYLVAVSEGTQGVDQARTQLITAHANIGRAFDPYYSKTVTQEFSRLLKEQGQLTLSLIDAAKKNDLRGFTSTQSQWKKNAGTLSTFLSKTNPYLTFSAIRPLLNEYLTSLVKMITSRINKRWAEDAQAYNELRAHNAQLAQAVAQAVADAFPAAKPTKKPVPPAQTPRLTGKLY